MSKFLQDDYEVPQTKSLYKRFEQGDNKFRVVSSAVVGYEYWNTNSKPVRLKHNPSNRPKDIRMNDDDSYTIKHFWAFVILDRWDNQIKILEITQSTIMKAIKKLVDNEEWGDPKGYDININKTGEKLTTEYQVQPSPHKPLTAEEENLINETPVNLEVLFSGGNPFAKQDEIVDVEEDEIKASDIAF